MNASFIGHYKKSLRIYLITVNKFATTFRNSSKIKIFHDQGLLTVNLSLGDMFNDR